MSYDWDETDRPLTEWSEPITLDEPTAKALLRHDRARDQYRTALITLPGSSPRWADPGLLE